MARSNCSYRIIENIHIGVRVRKTSGPGTVPFKNVPMKDILITDYNNRGFTITHPAMPREAFLDFGQLPLTEVTIEKGYIKTELAYVEALVGSQTLGVQLVRTDTLDYLEMLDDKKDKDSTPKFTLANFRPGDKMLSCICKLGNEMHYLGTFNTVTAKYKRVYKGNGMGSEYEYSFNKCTPQAYFAYKQNNGKFTVKMYSLTHKNVVELYRRDNDVDSALFADTTKNLEMLRSYQNFGYRNKNIQPMEPLYMEDYYSGFDHDLCYISDKSDKDVILKEAADYALTNSGIKIKVK